MHGYNHTATGRTNSSEVRLAIDLSDVTRSQRSHALVEHLRDAVRRGSLRAGTRLPPSRGLSADLGVSRGVVVRAYEQLVAEGYLDARTGRGTVVAPLPAPLPTEPPPPGRPPSNPGLPAGSSFPRAAWQRAAGRALGELADRDLGYGHPMGHEHLRTELSSYLGRVRGVVAPPERTMVVTGFAQAGRLLADVLQRRGAARIAVEDPGSRGLREQLERVGATCVPVPVDADGIRVDVLEDAEVAAVVVTPAHQFPTGVVLSAERRHALTRWARDRGAVILEDDYDAEFRYDRSPVGAVQGLAPDVVIHGGSVSKTLAPAVRLGWLVLPPAWVAGFVEAKYDADLATGVLEQATLAHLLAAGDLDRHVRRVTTLYRRRRDRLVRQLDARLPRWQVSGASAGLHLLVRQTAELLADPGAERCLARLATDVGLDARPLSSYAVERGDQRGLVIGYGHRSEVASTAAVARLADRLDV
jgi:GntR family transcriptional regulator/MocR family aminotransferase